MARTTLTLSGAQRTAVALLLLVVSGCVRRVVAVPRDIAATGETAPAGMVDVGIVSDDGVFDVYSAGAPVCATPCTHRFASTDRLMLQQRGGDGVFLDTLGREAIDARRALVVAEGPSEGKRVNGIVFTTLGGMGVIVAIVLTAVGCSNTDERGGTCTAGLITGGVTLPLTAAALWMLLDNGPTAQVLPVRP